MCDEVEQYHAFEQLWVDNDRRRTEEFQSEFLQAIDVLAADPTMAEQKFGMLRSHAEAVFKTTNELFDENAVEKSFEMQFRDMFEPVFRKVSYAPFVNWAHLEQVNLYIRLCRKKHTKVRSELGPAQKLLGNKLLRSARSMLCRQGKSRYEV